MSKTIVCFGDSNTFGADFSSPGGRLERRWPVVMAELLGSEYDVKEEGLSGRTIATDDTMWNNNLNGMKAFTDQVMPHAPVHLLIIMLGTNDVKESYGLAAQQITEHMGQLIEYAKSSNIWQDEKRLLLIAPTPIGDEVVGTSRLGQSFGGQSVEKSKQLGALYMELAKSQECLFIDAADHISVGTNDYVHLSAEGHSTLGIAISQFIQSNSI
ncbi:MAG: GDSL-type esterase/lipase family protein [Oscillospiraceae bacterium]|nr:GDSL-type esterase/lipase family protein [Oscillospiraceae bacterium]